MLPDRVSNPGPLTYESGALPIVLSGPTIRINKVCAMKSFHVDLTTLFLGWLSPPKGFNKQYFVHILSPVTDNCLS